MNNNFCWVKFKTKNSIHVNFVTNSMYACLVYKDFYFIFWITLPDNNYLPCLEVVFSQLLPYHTNSFFHSDWETLISFGQHTGSKFAAKREILNYLFPYFAFFVGTREQTYKFKHGKRQFVYTRKVSAQTILLKKKCVNCNKSEFATNQRKM